MKKNHGETRHSYSHDESTHRALLILMHVDTSPGFQTITIRAYLFDEIPDHLKFELTFQTFGHF
jgi:hypothetical protein